MYFNYFAPNLNDLQDNHAGQKQFKKMVQIYAMRVRSVSSFKHPHKLGTTFN